MGGVIKYGRIVTYARHQGHTPRDIVTVRHTNEPKDKSISFPCKHCGTEMLVSFLFHERYGGTEFFCSPDCKVRDIMSHKDPNACWTYHRAVFMLFNRSYSIRMYAYNACHNELLSYRQIRMACGNRKCVNPHHAKKK